MGTGVVPAGELAWQRSAEVRQHAIVGHLVLSAGAAMVASLIMVSAPGWIGPFLLFLFAIWMTVSELVNAVDRQFDFAWGDDDGAPRSAPWSEQLAVTAGVHTRELAHRIVRPGHGSVGGPVGDASGIEVMEIPEPDRGA